MRILKNRGVAFVTYKTRANAEFAREAMMNQNLENNEIINVRWATADPNAIANRLDAEDDKAEAERVAKILMESQGGSEEQQEEESELPAEFTSIKRSVDEDGFEEMENRVKKQRAEEEAKLAPTQQDAQTAESIYGYTQEDYNNYWYQQQAYYEQQQQQEQKQAQEKAGGIIPQNILANLKTLAKNTTIAAPVVDEKNNSKSTNGLGNLADYGSDSEDEE